MFEVLLLLKLRRRSGVLAAAVAAVHKAGLTFKSQQPRELDGSPALLLTTESDALPDHATLCDFITGVSGVDSVVEILVDGSPLLPVEASADSVFDEGRTPSAPGSSAPADDSPWLLGEETRLQEPPPVPAAEPSAADKPASTVFESESAVLPSVSSPEMVEMVEMVETASEPGVERDREPEPEVVPQAAEPAVDRPASPVVTLHPRPETESESVEVVESESSAEAGPDDRQDDSSGREMTRAMKRRWRRYR